MLALIAVVALGYLVGSCPVGLVVGRYRASTDIRLHGSGSTGFTNAARVLGLQAGLVVLAADVAKGLVAAGLVARLGAGRIPLADDSVALAAGFAAVAGHIWPVFGRFRGGKGVATAAGVLLAVRPLIAFLCAALFGAVVLATGFVSVASVGVALSLPALLLLLRLTSGQALVDPLLGFCAMLAPLIVGTHRSNLARLRAGTEPRAL